MLFNLTQGLAEANFSLSRQSIPCTHRVRVLVVEVLVVEVFGPTDPTGSLPLALSCPVVAAAGFRSDRRYEGLHDSHV